MAIRWLLAAIVALLVGGCVPQDEAAPPAAPPSKAAKKLFHDSPRPLAQQGQGVRAAAIEKATTEPVSASSQESPEKPPKKVAKPAEESPPPLRLTDDFNLPLVIVIDAPEVPPEIQGPSPPIQQEPPSH